MGKVNDLAELCRRALGEKGRLSTAIPGFIARIPQIELSVAIAETIGEKSILVAEAGTGTGKTFAYLLPCILSGKKTLISTATKTLQDQLYQKDLPTLVKALGLSTRIQNLKGRANYICRYRVALYAEEGQFQTPQCANDILHVREKLGQMKQGERSELPEISEDSSVWPYVTSTTDNCLGTECTQYQSCFLVQARRRALDAEVVIINHHLFFADSRLKQEGFGELLPGVDTVIFDEAHQLTEIAVQFDDERIGTRQFQELVDDIIREWPVLDLASQPLKALSHQANQLSDALVRVLSIHDERCSWEEVARDSAFMITWEKWLAFKDDLMTCFNSISLTDKPGLARCKQRLEEFERLLVGLSKPNTNKLRWIERFKHTVVFHATPYDVADSFSELLNKKESAYVFTSATLTVNASFNYFCKPLGLNEVKTLLVPSPFDYAKQCLLYLPRELPDPKNANYHEALLTKALPIINALEGRCFFLFTSHKALQLVAHLMSNKIHYPILVQGDEAKPILLERFRQLGNAILLGTNTFWEGVDVKGEALSCVIIDKLPFASPVDPVMRGRMAYLKKQGLSGFDEISLPNAVIALKQGVGRLIRDITDTGVLMIADPRLTSREYGRHILASLPSLPKTRDEKRVLDFINQLALNDEIISN